MNRILIICILLFGTQATITNTFAQSKEPATIYIYRPGKFACVACKAEVQFNDVDITVLTNKTKLKYLLFNEGKLNIKVNYTLNKWSASTSLNIKSGKTYYVKVDFSISGIKLINNSSDAMSEYDEIPNKNLISLIEDVDNPIIEQKYSQTIMSVKTDTIKQIVYVDSNAEKRYNYKPVSDIDSNIPNNTTVSNLQFALIIGNEDYTSFQNDLKNEMNVEFARNDASAFKEYTVKTLGIPEKNITFILDGTAGQINQAINKLNLIAKNTNGKASFILYYAGHGLPNETTKEPYLIPVDVSGSDLSSGIKLKDLYYKLTEYPSKRVLVFFDACFTGGGRNQGLLSARGVKVKPKEELLKGNIVVFSSSSEDQSSLPIKDKQHGLFTYYLLKKVQETKGNIKLKELSSYLKEQVSLESVVSNNKEQNPQITSSSDILNEWGDWYLNF